jgi:hypothetical protein
MSHMQLIEGPEPRLVVRPQAGMWADLKQAFSVQYGRAKAVVTDPKAPQGRGMKWWNYVRDMRTN